MADGKRQDHAAGGDQAECGRSKGGDLSRGAAMLPSWGPAERGVGYVPQDFGIIPARWTVQENMEIALGGGRSKVDIAERVGEMSGYIRHRALPSPPSGSLSGGDRSASPLAGSFAFTRPVLWMQTVSALDADHPRRKKMYRFSARPQQTKITVLAH